MKHIAGLGLLLLLIFLFQPAAAFEFGELAERVEIHGFLSQGFLKSCENNFVEDALDGTFEFNEMGLTLSSNVTDRLHAGVQLFSRDLGDLGNNAIQIDWAYGDYRWKDWLGIRVGKVKLSFGLYNETRDIDSLRTWIFLPESLYNEYYRDTFHAMYGIEGYGYIPLNALGSLNYQVQFGEKNISTDSAIAKEFSTEDEIYTFGALEVKDALSCGLDWETPVEGLRMKGWMTTFDMQITIRVKDLPELPDLGIPPGTRQQHRERDNTYNTLSVEYVRDRVTMMAEYATGKDENGRNEGYYLGAAFRVTDSLQLGAYYSEYYLDADDKDGSEYEARGLPNHRAWYKDLTATVRFDINDSWLVKLEGHAVNGTCGLWEDENPDGLEEQSYVFAIKTTFNF